MKKTFSFLFVMLVATFLTSNLFAQNDKSDRIKSSYLIALGRLPNGAELNHWMGRENYSLQQLVDFQTDYLRRTPSEKRRAAIKAFVDSYGYQPNENQISTNMATNLNYTEAVNNHVKWLRSNSKDYNEMIAKVYWNVCGRWATDNDRRSWPQSEAKPYMVVAAVVEHWRNLNSTPKNTVGNNSKYLEMLKVSNTVANEAAKVIAAGGGNVIAAGGGNVIAAGGGNVISAGGGNVVAVGGGN